MSKVIETGGPAFPCAEIRGPDGEGYRQGHDGMTLRDWFAGQALTGVLSAPQHYPSPVDAVGIAYLLADAMLKARKGEPR